MVLSTVPEDRKQKALESAQEFVKYLVVLSVGALGFVLAMLQPTTRDSTLSVALVTASAVLLAISVFLGILAYGTLISQLYNNEIDLENPYLSRQARWQWILFFAGIIALGAALFVRDVMQSHQQGGIADPSHLF